MSGTGFDSQTADESTQSNLQLAMTQDYPAFVSETATAATMNGAPCFCKLTQLLAGAVLPEHHHLVAALDALRSALLELGLQTEVILIACDALGAKTRASELDAVIFYRAHDTPIWGEVRLELSVAFQAGIDARLVPVDAPLLVHLRATLLFGTLQSMPGSDRAGLRQLLLVDCLEHDMA